MSQETAELLVAVWLGLLGIGMAWVFRARPGQPNPDAVEGSMRRHPSRWQ